jgi:hypothetical protein
MIVKRRDEQGSKGWVGKWMAESAIKLALLPKAPHDNLDFEVE